LEKQQDTFDQVRGRVTAARALAPIERARMALAQRSLLVRAHDPRNALARGFSLTYGASGQLIRSASALAPTETIRTLFADGHAVATVLETQIEPTND
jgi:exonuclease VII large subunit